MIIEELLKLSPGDLLYDFNLECTVDVKFGSWSNTIEGGLRGTGLYLEYQDGSGHEIGLDIINEHAVRFLNYIPAEEHSRYY